MTLDFHVYSFGSKERVTEHTQHQHRHRHGVTFTNIPR